MNETKVKELGMRVIHDVCDVNVTIEEAVTTFELVADALLAHATYELVTKLAGDGVVEDAEQILKEAIEDVDQ